MHLFPSSIHLASLASSPALLLLALLIPPGPTQATGFVQSVGEGAEGGGAPMGKIVGGVAANSTSTFPFAVSLYTGSSHLLACGAAILSENWVVTAAHCLIDVNTVVASTIYAKREVSSITLGVGSLKNVTSSPLTLQSAIIHPNYDAVNQTNDIALLQLTSPLSFSPAIQPIRVHGVIDVAAGTNVTALGWGATETEKRSPILRSVSLTTTQGARCTNAFPDYSASESNLVCIGGSQGKDTCYGDSGGPLVTSLPQGTSGGGQVDQGLVGLTSFSVNNIDPQPDDCGLQNTVVFYTHVAKYIPWISHTTNMPVNSFSVLSSSTSASSIIPTPSWVLPSLLALMGTWGLGGVVGF